MYLPACVGCIVTLDPTWTCRSSLVLCSDPSHKSGRGSGGLWVISWLRWLSGNEKLFPQSDCSISKRRQPSLFTKMTLHPGEQAGPLTISLYALHIHVYYYVDTCTCILCVHVCLVLDLPHLDIQMCVVNVQGQCTGQWGNLSLAETELFEMWASSMEGECDPGSWLSRIFAWVWSCCHCLWWQFPFLKAKCFPMVQ